MKTKKRRLAMFKMDWKEWLFAWCYALFFMGMVWISSERIWPLIARVSGNFWDWRLAAVLVIPMALGFFWGTVLFLAKKWIDSWYLPSLFFAIVFAFAKSEVAGLDAIGGLLIYLAGGVGTYLCLSFFDNKEIGKFMFPVTSFFYLLPSVFDSSVKSGIFETNTYLIFLLAFVFAAIFSWFSKIAFYDFCPREWNEGIFYFLRETGFIGDGTQLDMMNELGENEQIMPYISSGVKKLKISSFNGNIVLCQDRDGTDLKMYLHSSGEEREGFRFVQRDDSVDFRPGLGNSNSWLEIVLPCDIDDIAIDVSGRITINGRTYGLKRMTLFGSSIVTNGILVTELFYGQFTGCQKHSTIFRLSASVVSLFVLGMGHHLSSNEITAEKIQIETGQNVCVQVQELRISGDININRLDGSAVTYDNGGLQIK